MLVTPTHLKFVGENPPSQSVKISGLTATQAWHASATDGIFVGPADSSGVNDYSCTISVGTLKVGEPGTVTIWAPGHEPVVVTIERV